MTVLQLVRESENSLVF